MLSFIRKFKYENIMVVHPKLYKDERTNVIASMIVLLQENGFGWRRYKKLNEYTQFERFERHRLYSSLVVPWINKLIPEDQERELIELYANYRRRDYSTKACNNLQYGDNVVPFNKRRGK